MRSTREAESDIEVVDRVVTQNYMTIITLSAWQDLRGLTGG